MLIKIRASSTYCGCLWNYKFITKKLIHGLFFVELDAFRFCYSRTELL